jgi:hypothetical protein
MVSIWQSAVRAPRLPRRTPAGLNLALAAFFIGLLAFPASAFAKEEPTVNISVLVYDYAAFGFAVSPGLASVYYGDAALMAKRQNLRSEFPPLLGCLMVHEIGHLLLNSFGHSPTEVMQAEWGPMQLRQSLTGLMTFTPAQSRLIREQVQARMNLPLEVRTAGTSSR